MGRVEAGAGVGLGVVLGLEGVGGVDFSGVGVEEVEEGFSVLDGEDFAGVEG